MERIGSMCRIAIPLYPVNQILSRICGEPYTSEDGVAYGRPQEIIPVGDSRGFLTTGKACRTWWNFLKGWHRSNTVMYKNILLATDGSENARRAAGEAAGFAREGSSHVTMVHIKNSPPSQSRMVKANFDVHSILEEDAKSEIKNTIDIFEKEGLPYTLKVAIGDPAAEIFEIAAKEHADLIIIGSRGLGAIKGVFLGSVSQKVAQHAPCPVLIVK